MAARTDPRDIVTPDAFSVAPELLGLPLARPWRRAAAMSVDLAAIGLLANAPGVLLALAAGGFLFWLAFRGRKQSSGSSLARGTLGCLGVLLLLIAVSVVFVSRVVDEDTVLFQSQGPGGENVAITVGAIGDITTLLSAGDTVAVTAAAQRIVDRLSAQGISGEQMRTVLADIAEDGDASMLRAIERALPPTEAMAEPAPRSLDSLLAAYTAARAAGDSAVEADLRPLVGSRLAEEQLTAREQEIVRLTARNEQLSAQVERTEEALEEEQDKGIVRTVLGFLDELGLGLGWSGLYFTFMTAVFHGRTPGKRLLGIRVLRLDGKPLRVWVAFERFGGYAASLFTGLEGFLRILWDRNRQGLEDKLAETVVIRETKEVRARLAMAQVERILGAPVAAGTGGGPPSSATARAIPSSIPLNTTT